MVNKFEIERLKLAYQRQLYYLNAILLLATIGVLSFIGTFIWKKDLVTIGFISPAIIFLISSFGHNKIDKVLKEISDKIKNLN